MQENLPHDEESRRLAIARLAGSPLTIIAEELFTAMGDSSWRVRKEAVDTLIATGEVGDDLILRLVDLLSAEENAGQRNSASEALERLGKLAVRGLCSSLTVPDPDVRKFIVDILGAISSAEAVPFLLPLLDDSEPNVVSAVVETLGKIGDPVAGAALIRLLERDDLFLRFAILEALGNTKCPVPLSAVLPLMGNNLLKKAAYDCLGAVGTVESVPLLISGLSEKGRSAREAATSALMRLRDRISDRESICIDEQLQRINGSPLIDVLLGTLETAELPFKRTLVRILGLTRDSRAMVPLLKAAQCEEIDRECRQAIHDIGGAGVDALLAYFPLATEQEQRQIVQICVSLGIRTCGAILVEAVRSAEPEVREKAVAAIGLLAMTELVSLVVEALDDQEVGVQEEAVNALVRQAGQADAVVLPIAIRLADSFSPKDRCAAARLLFPSGGGNRLFFLLKDEEAMVRTAAVAALSQEGSADARHAICLALMDETPEVRIAAANAIGVYKASEAVEPLMLLLDDRDQRVQRAALRNLSLLGDPASVPAIENLLVKSSGLLKINAMESLVALSGSAATPLIEQELTNPDDEIVKAAIFLLAASNPQQLIEHHQRLLLHSHWEVRSTMARALCDAIGAEAAPLLTSALDNEQDDYVKSQISMLLDRIA